MWHWIQGNELRGYTRQGKDSGKRLKADGQESDGRGRGIDTRIFEGLERGVWLDVDWSYAVFGEGGGLEPVINFRVGSAESQFFRVLEARSDAYRVSASDERQRNRENWPQPPGLRRKSRDTLLSSSPWNRQSLRPPPRLARFSLATLPAGKLITGI